MNYKAIQLWLGEHDINLDESFTDAVRRLAETRRNNHYCTLSQAYAQFGCTKESMSRWKYNPCSTQASCRKAKLAVAEKTALLCGLSCEETEAFVNKAGLSLLSHGNELEALLRRYRGKVSDLLKLSNVSERMLEYYLAGKTPTKQALLAITISAEITTEEIQELLLSYGYCLSASLPNDAVVRWYLEHGKGVRRDQLYEINNVLEYLWLPLLMTKIYNR